MRRTATLATATLLLTATTVFAAETPDPNHKPAQIGQQQVTTPAAKPPVQQSRLQAAKQKLAQAMQKPPSGDKLDRMIETARARAASAIDRMRSNGSLRDLMDRVAARQ